MLEAVISWLGRAGPLVFWTCAFVLVALDSVAVAAVIATRSRELVNRWAGPVLAANLILAGVGVAVPGAMFVVKAAVSAVASSVPSLVTVDGGSAAQR